MKEHIKTVISILVFVLIYGVCSVEGDDQGEAGWIEKTAEIDKKIKNTSDSSEKAKLLYEKAELIIASTDEKAAIAEAVDILLKATEIDPYDEDVQKQLFIIYEKFINYPAHPDMLDRETSGKVKDVVRKFNDNINFDHLVGPFELRELLNDLNDSDIYLFSGKDTSDLKRERISLYSAENGWFELEGTYDYNEMYRADINNDGKEEYIYVSADDMDDSLRIKGIYEARPDGRYKDIYPDVRRSIKDIMAEKVKSYYGIEKMPDMQGVEVRISKKEGLVYLTIGIKPFWRDRESFGDHRFDFRFIWDKKGIREIKDGAEGFQASKKG